MEKSKTFPLRCSVCDSIYWDKSHFERLQFIGHQDNGDDQPIVEFRACSCKNTLAIEVEKE